MLEAKDISYGYPKQDALFRDLSLSVEPGERVALQAPSGCGKTTLCKIIAGYLRPLSGKIYCDGSLLPEKGRLPVQMIWQHPEKAVDPRLRMEKTLSEVGGVSKELLFRLGIRQEWLTRYPHELSGGELQRFCIARALASDPRYLIADEISTMLDALTQAEIWRFLLEELKERDIGLLFVSHSKALTDHIATRIISIA